MNPRDYARPCGVCTTNRPTRRIYVTDAEADAIEHALNDAIENAIEWPEQWEATRDGLQRVVTKLKDARR